MLFFSHFLMDIFVLSVFVVLVFFWGGGFVCMCVCVCMFVSKGKYAPYILSGCLLPLSKLMIPGTTRTPFIKGLYPVIDMCTTYDRELVHAALPQDARLLYKRVFDDYKRFHKYKGQF